MLLIDHVPKQRIDRPMGPIGSQYKRQAVQGASLFASGQPWTKQADGRIVLRLHKDRMVTFPAFSISLLQRSTVSTLTEGTHLLHNCARQ